MMDKIRILAINPGSTSTKIALYEDETPVFWKKVEFIAPYTIFPGKDEMEALAMNGLLEHRWEV